jgi:hypothetical protein
MFAMTRNSFGMTTSPTFYWRIGRELSVEVYIVTQAAAICPFQVFLLFIIEFVKFGGTISGSSA